MLNAMYDITGKRVWLAGHRDLVGSAFPTRPATEPIGDVVTGASVVLEGRDQPATERFVVERRPEVVAAARVGGINGWFVDNFDSARGT